MDAALSYTGSGAMLGDTLREVAVSPCLFYTLSLLYVVFLVANSKQRVAICKLIHGRLGVCSVRPSEMKRRRVEGSNGLHTDVARWIASLGTPDSRRPLKLLYTIGRLNYGTSG